MSSNTSDHSHSTTSSSTAIQHQQCPHCLAELPGQSFQQKLVLERVETRESWTTVSSWSTMSNIRGPGRTVGKIISKAGRSLERAMATIPEILSTPPEVILHQKAEKSLKEAKLKLSNQIRVLLLGSCDSGKSDLLKQMRLIHDVRYTPNELETYRQFIFKFLISGILRILDALDKRGLDLSEDIRSNVDVLENAGELPVGERFPMTLYAPLQSLWNDPSVQAVWKERDLFELPESLSYFFSSLDRLFESEYVPSFQDIMRTELRTSSVRETIFKFPVLELIIVDANPMGDRRKWINQFSVVDAALFVVNLAGYDQCLVEDRHSNQLQDAMTIWDSVCLSELFRQKSLVLFLNKYDLFAEKVVVSDIKNYFPDYEGHPGNVEEGVEYFKKRFVELANKPQQWNRREVYVHVTNPTDTAMLQVLEAFLEDMVTRRQNKE